MIFHIWTSSITKLMKCLKNGPAVKQNTVAPDLTRTLIQITPTMIKKFQEKIPGIFILPIVQNCAARDNKLVFIFGRIKTQRR